MGVDPATDILTKLIPVEIALLAVYVAFLNFLPKLSERVEQVESRQIGKPAQLHRLQKGVKRARAWIRFAIYALTASLIAEVLFIVFQRTGLFPALALNLLWYVGPLAFIASALATIFSLWPWWALYLYLLER